MPEDFSPQQSLQLIQSMINKTKLNMSENRFYFLLWGWVAFLCILAQFVLKNMLDYRHHYLVWLATFVAFIITIVRGRQRVQKQKVRTYIGDTMGYLWMGIGISFFVLTFIISAGIGWLQAWPFMILMYGLGTFISGKILQFKPLVVGGILNWFIASATVFFPYDYQLLFAAAAVATSYLIPAYLIKKES